MFQNFELHNAKIVCQSAWGVASYAAGSAATTSRLHTCYESPVSPIPQSHLFSVLFARSAAAIIIQRSGEKGFDRAESGMLQNKRHSAAITTHAQKVGWRFFSPLAIV